MVKIYLIQEKNLSKDKLNHKYEMSYVKVNINDKLNKLEDYYSIDEDISGPFIYNGKLIENMADLTFAKKFVLHDSTFGMICDGSEFGKELRWKRCPDLCDTDYFYISDTYWDGITYIPKRTVRFYGFCIMGNYHSKDMTYTVKWVIDEIESEEYTVEFTESNDLDSEFKWYEVRLKDCGCKPPKVEESGKIDILIKCVKGEREYRRSYYGHNGYCVEDIAD